MLIPSNWASRLDADIIEFCNEHSGSYCSQECERIINAAHAQYSAMVDNEEKEQVFISAEHACLIVCFG